MRGFCVSEMANSQAPHEPHPFANFSLVSTSRADTPSNIGPYLIKGNSP